MTYLIALLQLLLTLSAGYALFVGWKAIWNWDRRAGMVVAVGLGGRLFAGALLFWVSWLNLPVFQKMHVAEHGFWFFARDATGYFVRAIAATEEGVWYLLSNAQGSNAPFFVQSLGASIYFFGPIPSVAVLLNCAAYLGASAIMVRVGGRSDLTVASLLAIAISPSMTLWSTQGLKDVVFFFLIAAFVGAACIWQNAWRAAGRRAVLSGVLILALLYAIAGIRWYFAAIFVGMLVPFLILVTFQARRRLAATLASSLLLAVMILAAAVPLWRTVLPVARALLRVNYSPAQITLFMVMKAREGFDRADASTLIGAGPVVRALDRRAGAATSDQAAVRSTKGVKKKAARQQKSIDPEQVASAESVRARAKEIRGAKKKGGRRGGDDKRPDVVMPRSHAGRLIAGTAAMVLPRPIATALGLVDIRGGRGLFLFADLDTVWFDGVVALALVALLGAFSARSARSPLLWVITVAAVVLAVLLAYTISNFGTLFRHRDMIAMLLAMVPLLVEAERRARTLSANAGAAPAEDAASS